MNIKSDIEIAQEHTPKKITEVAATAGIDEKFLELYGNYKAKVDIRSLKDLPRKSKLVLVTAISPTPAGEGKTTTSVGLADALNRLGRKGLKRHGSPTVWNPGCPGDARAHSGRGRAAASNRSDPHYGNCPGRCTSGGHQL